MFGSANLDNHTPTSTRSSRDGEPEPEADIYACLPASASGLIPESVGGAPPIGYREGVEACG
jgi:hypothetical protein